MRERILMCWSGGKDSAMALYELQKSERYEIAALLTTVTESYERISMHGVRCELLHEQADSIGIGLEKVYISQHASNTEYESNMEVILKRYYAEGVRSVAFGDIFLEDLRIYRENNLAKIGMKGLFPIWKRETNELAREFIRLGFQSMVVCIDPKSLGRDFVGRKIDQSFLDDLPPAVDPCGENGEYHSFVFDGPIFKNPIHIQTGEKVLRDSFWFCDLLPVESKQFPV